jgi:hypothetical protein
MPSAVNDYTQNLPVWLFLLVIRAKVRYRDFVLLAIPGYRYWKENLEHRELTISSTPGVPFSIYLRDVTNYRNRIRRKTKGGFKL